MSEAGSPRITTAPDRGTGLIESPPLANRYRSAAPIEWQGSTVYPMYTEQLATSSSALSITLLSATPPPELHSFGLGLSMVDGYIGLDGRQLAAVDIWHDALTGGVVFELSATARGALFTLTPVWTDTDGKPRSWSGNYGILVDQRTDNRVVLRCSMGAGAPNFTDLVVEVRTAPTDAPTAPQPKLTTTRQAPEISMPFGAPVPSTPSSLPAIAATPVANDQIATGQPPPETPQPPPVSTISDCVSNTQESGADSIFGSPIQWEPPIEADQERASVYLPPHTNDESDSATSYPATSPPAVTNAGHIEPNRGIDSTAENSPSEDRTTAFPTGPSAPTAAVPTDTGNGAASVPPGSTTRSIDDRRKQHSPAPDSTCATSAIRGETATDTATPATTSDSSSAAHNRNTGPPNEAAAAPLSATPQPTSARAPHESNNIGGPTDNASAVIPESYPAATLEPAPEVHSPPQPTETYAAASHPPMTAPPSGTLKHFGATSADPNRTLTTAETSEENRLTAEPGGTAEQDRTHNAVQASEAEALRTVRLGHLTLTTTRDAVSDAAEPTAHETDGHSGPEPVPSIGPEDETSSSSGVKAPDLRIANADQETTPLRPFEAPARKNHSYRNALYDLAVAMHGRGEQEQAYRLWAQAVSAGHAEAAYDLGVVCFRHGDLNEAERWWRTAAHRRVMRAMAALAELLDRRGDHAQARLWRSQAATEYAVATQDRNALEQHDDAQPADHRGH